FNGVAVVGDVWTLSGISIIPGAEGPSAARAPLIRRAFNEDLVLCRRYLQVLPSMIVDTALVFQSIVLSPPMRIAPAVAGGGAGFTLVFSTTGVVDCYQTSRNYQDLILNARM